jgi:hypothetical protein
MLHSFPHSGHAGVPADKDRLAEYEAAPYKGHAKKIQEAFAAIAPEDARLLARFRGSHSQGC